MSEISRSSAPTVAPADPQARKVAKARLRESQSHLLGLRQKREARRVRAEAQVAAETAKIKVLDQRLDRLAEIARVIDEGWDASTASPKLHPHRSTLFPRGALSRGALRILRVTGRSMTAKEIAAALSQAHGFPVPHPTILGTTAQTVSQALRAHFSRHPEVLFPDRSQREIRWSIRPLPSSSPAVT